MKVLVNIWVLIHVLGLMPHLEALLYPESSVLSMVCSVSVPVVEYFPERRILIDWIFTMTHTLPSKLSSFYNIPIWPVKYTPKIEKRYINEQQNFNQTQLFNKYRSKVAANRHYKDISAGELYQAMEDWLVSYGFHETCLLRSVCELAQHPFDDKHQNILTEVLTFILTPSLHESFDDNEKLYRTTYENAELRGFFGENCTRLYADCKIDLLGGLTKVIHITNG